MVKRIHRLGHKAFFAAIFGLAIAVLGGVTAHAESPNQFPGITGGSSDWIVNRNSPDPNLTWLFKANPPNETINGRTTHILRNRSIGRNEGTRLRVYYAREPQQVSITINVVACELDAPAKYAGAVRVVLGGRERYKQNTLAPFRVDHYERDRVWPNGGGSSRVAGPEREVDSSTRYANSPVCDNYGSSSVPVWIRRENCAPAQQTPSGGCKNNGTETYAVDQSGNGNYTVPATNTRLDNKTFTVNFQDGYDPDGDGSPEMGFDANTNMYYADLDVDLSANNDPALVPNSDGDVMQRITFNVTANNAVGPSGNTIIPRMGYRFFNDEVQASRFFGLQGNGGRNTTYPGYGQKLAVPFGPSCRASGVASGKIILYDPDVNGFGPVYMTVFKRNPANGNVVRLNKGDYLINSAWRVAYDDANNRIRSTANSNENSFFYVEEMEPGFQYMLVIINPHLPSKSDPSSNVYSLRLPTDSMNGLVNCRFELIPSMNGVATTFSYRATLSPRGAVEKVDPNTSTGNHQWKMTRAVFDRRPSDLSRTAFMDSLRGECLFIAERSGAYESCDNIHTDTYPANEWEEKTDTVGPYPPGYYVCYITSVKDPTWRTDDNNEWRYSRMQCSVSGVKPKVQAWGYDVKARGVIGTSTVDVDGKRYGSWGEYGVFSNGRNRLMASGNGLLNAPSGSGQASWSQMTFGDQTTNCGGVGGFGCYGAVSTPLVSRDGATTLGSPDLNVNSLSDLITSPNQRGTVVINGTLRINGNLTYPSTVTDISKLPRTVIIANKIIIAPGVTRIDPWLVAVTNGPGTGIISTCSTIGGDTPLPMATAGLSSTVCNQQLVFNGPVIADRIYLYRTHDSETGDPAEIFNLRADNFLASYVGGGPDEPVATTDNVVELPPRF